MWKKFIYEGIETDYSVSTEGEVRKDTTNYILSQSSQQDYKFVTLLINGQQKRMRVHRMVAMTFIENPDNKPYVNHINGIRYDNNVENLEWATYKENNAYGDRLKRQGETFKANGKISKRVNQYDLDGNFIATYRSMREAERINGISNGSVSTSIKKGWNMGGYHWEIVE